MLTGTALRGCAAAALLCYGAAAGLAWRWERARPTPAAEDGVLRDRFYAQSSDGEDGGPRTFQRLRTAADSYFAEYGFTNFSQDVLTVRFTVPKATYDAYQAGFWYSRADLDAIETWHNNARQGAYQFAVKSKKTQAQLDTAMNNLKAERDKKVRDYLASKGFKMLPGNVLEPDMPQIVKRSAGPLKPLALAIDKIASAKNYDSESLVGSVAALVQTALQYKIPPPIEGGKHTGGLLPPMTALVRGWGDCDTKTGLLASILANWPQRMVGIAVPGHYLMGILRIPNKGDIFIEHQGLQYVLIEPAGPAWLPPGKVGEDTMPKLQASEGFRVEPFFDASG